MRVKSNSKPHSARKLLDQLVSHGRYYFTSSEARSALGVSVDASKLAISRLKRQGSIASPARGFYVIVPPEYRSLGCLPAEQFIPYLMEYKHAIYYAGLLSAAQYYGAAHQRPQEFQVFVTKNRRPIRCGKVQVKFIARKNMARVKVRPFNTSHGQIQVSTPEATAIDLVGYPQHAGGLNHVATVLFELAHEIDPDELQEAAVTAPVSWAQRLGYLLEFVDASERLKPLQKWVQENAREYARLAPASPSEKWQRNKTWKLEVNTQLDPDL